MRRLTNVVKPSGRPIVWRSVEPTVPRPTAPMDLEQSRLAPALERRRASPPAAPAPSHPAPRQECAHPLLAFAVQSQQRKRPRRLPAPAPRSRPNWSSMANPPTGMPIHVSMTGRLCQTFTLSPRGVSLVVGDAQRCRPRPSKSRIPANIRRASALISCRTKSALAAAKARAFWASRQRFAPSGVIHR